MERIGQGQRGEWIRPREGGLHAKSLPPPWSWSDFMEQLRLVPVFKLTWVWVDAPGLQRYKPGHPEEANGGWTAEAMLMRLHHCAGSYDGLDCPLGFIQSSLPTFLRLKYSVCKKILLHNSQSKEPVNKSSWEMVLQRKGHWTHSVLFSQPCSVFMLSCNFL